MRFARVVSAHDCYNPTIDQLAEHADLDLLQLDYRWPNDQLDDEQTLGMYSVGFEQQLKSLHRWLYLDPRLRLVTNAGGGNTLGCVEALAVYLCEHDHGELPVSRVQGDNVLAILEELLTDGVEAEGTNSCEAKDWKSGEIVAAQVEIGAGPLATALAEGSRIVVGGCYDVTAPSIAAGVSGFGWSWEDTSRLAQLAVATNCAGEVAEVDEKGEVVMTRRQHVDLSFNSSNELLQHADVVCRVAECSLVERGSQGFEISGVAGEKPSGDWRLRLVRKRGFVAEAVLRCSKANYAAVVDVLQSLKSNDQARFGHYQGADSASDRLLRVSTESLDREHCEVFVRDLLNLSVQQPQDFQLLGQLPRTSSNFETVYCRVPRDRIVVSVDTRTASEWR